MINKKIFLFKSKIFFSSFLLCSFLGYSIRWYYYIDYDIDIFKPKLTSYHKDRL